MAATVLQQLSQMARIMYPAANVSTNGFTALAPTKTPPDPTAGGILELSGPNLGGAGQAAAGAVLQFFGTSANAQTFSAQLWGWSCLPGDNSHFDLWVPKPLCTFTGITLDSAFPGVSGTMVASTNMFASAITLGTGTSGVSVEVISPGSGVGPCHVVASVKGSRYLQMLFSTGGVATDCNGIWRPL